MLRHRVDLGELAGVDRSVEERRRIIPMYPPAPRVEFRRGKNSQEVAGKMKSLKMAELCAAVGAGKSTQIPLSLSRSMGKLVIHTIPFWIAARYMAEFLANKLGEENVVFCDDIHADLPSHGVVLMSNACFISRYLNNSFEGCDGPVLYLDESHESDMWTACVRDCAAASAMFSCVVRATATADPGASMKDDLPGVRELHTYPRTSVASWTAHDKGKPWNVSTFEGSVLLCIDRVETVKALSVEYAKAGVDVHCLTARSTYKEFLDAVRALENAQQLGLVAVFVDYAYRSSFTLPKVNRIIDSCEVAYATIDADGLPKYAYRAAYQFEVQQFLGRGGRIAGEKVQLWHSSEPPPKKMCDLEAIEADAANLVFRLMGFRPPIRLCEFDYYDGPIPIDVAGALLHKDPVRLVAPEQRVPWVDGREGYFEEKKEQAKYQYNFPERVKPKPVSCHTVVDVERPKSPPPPVPKKYAVSRYDVDALSECSRRSSRESLPTIYTLKSGSVDNVSVFEDPDSRAFAKPKRVAKHVQEQRDAAARLQRLEDERLQAEEDERLYAETLQRQNVAQNRADAAARLSGPVDLPADVGVVGDSESRAPVMPRRGMDSVNKAVGDLHRVLTKHEHGFDHMRLDDSQLSSYFYYHGMDKAPLSSTYFLRGYDSIVRFSEEPDARRHVRAMPERDKLYAMRELVNMFNNSTAVAMGTDRLFGELSRRDKDELMSVVDPQKLIEVFEWMTKECMEAQLRMRMCRDIMPLYQKYQLEPIAPAEQLEQQVMMQLMERFESATIKKDPDKVFGYLDSLNNRKVRIGPVLEDRKRPMLTLR